MSKDERCNHAHHQRQESLTATVAVIGCREDCDHFMVVAPVVAFHDQLVGPGN
jgi:hypothetical protein